MKLEVGMYVRTTDGLLALLTELYNENSVIVKWQYDEKRRRESFSQSISKDYIKKASHNIIDLIEVGDYVNGVEVMEVDLEEKPYLKFVHGISTTDVGLITYMGDSKLYGIKSIVTKEQFKANEYVVE